MFSLVFLVGISEYLFGFVSSNERFSLGNLFNHFFDIEHQTIGIFVSLLIAILLSYADYLILRRVLHGENDTQNTTKRRDLYGFISRFIPPFVVKQKIRGFVVKDLVYFFRIPRIRVYLWLYFLFMLYMVQNGNDLFESSTMYMIIMIVGLAQELFFNQFAYEKKGIENNFFYLDGASILVSKLISMFLYLGFIFILFYGSILLIYQEPISSLAILYRIALFFYSYAFLSLFGMYYSIKSPVSVSPYKIVGFVRVENIVSKIFVLIIFITSISLSLFFYKEEPFFSLLCILGGMFFLYMLHVVLFSKWIQLLSQHKENIISKIGDFDRDGY